MGKTIKKLRPAAPQPVNTLNLEAMARSLVERGLAEPYILSPRRANYTQWTAGERDAAPGTNTLR